MSDHDHGDACEGKEVTLEELVFGNRIILENLFKFCTRKELSTCRLVSKLWYYLSAPFWSEAQAPIRLYERSRDGMFDKNRHMTIPTFLDNYRESLLRTGVLSVTPCTSFKLMFFRNLSFGDISPSVSQFWKECGPWITKLQLIGGRIEEFAAYKDVLLSTFTPNLKILKFSCLYDPKENERLNPAPEGPFKPNWNLESLSFFYCFPKIEWSEIFSHYPSLKSLELSAPYQLMNWDREIQKMLTTIADIRAKDATKLRLTNLKINVAGMITHPNDFLPISLSELLRNAKLPLEGLSVDGRLFEGVENQTQLDLIFDTFQGTLKRLQVRNGLNDAILALPVTVLPSLKELTLVGNCFKNMEILKLTPNLEVLHCLNPWRCWSSDTFMSRGGCFVDIDAEIDLQMLKDLRFDYGIGTSTMEMFVRSMPHVKTLAMPLNNETFRIVCENWKQLNHLTVHKDFLDDDGICGVLQHNRSHASIGAYAEHDLFPNQPCITDLQDLRSFVMENHRFDTSSDLEDIVTTRDLLPTRLTERSFVHGFMKLPRLLTLSVTVASYTVPEHLVRVLKETIGNVNIVQMQNLYRHNQM